MENITLKLISMKDIIDAGCFDIGGILDTMETALLEYKAGKVMMPDKISQIFDEKTQNRINCMPSTLMERSICGVKWVSVFPENPKKYDCANVSGIIVLSELEKGYPYAVMDGSFITAVRTACMGAIAAKYLAKPDSVEYCAIGTGEQAKMHFMAIKHLVPSVKVCRVASRNSDSEMRFIEEMSARYPEVSFEPCDSDYVKAAQGADIIVTAVSCQSPLLKAEAVKKGAFYCHVGGWEDEYEVPLKADKIVCDQWEAVKHRAQTISRLYMMGRLKDEDIYGDIADIIDGTKAGRETDEEFIYFNSVGLSFIDMAVADYCYKRATARGKFQEWVIQDNSLFGYLG